MTREEAIFCEKSYIGETNCVDCKYYGTDTCLSRESHRMAIKALEQEPVLDKIRAEIREEKECAYAEFERYKIEYLGQDQEDVLDSLPQDEFRYGMERAIEIINKYKGESEDEA